MTIEKVYSQLLKYINTLEQGEQNMITKIVERGDKWDEKVVSNVSILSNLLIDIKADIVQKECRTRGSSGVLKCAKYILKSAIKNCPESHAFTQTGIIDNIQIICDGFIALCLNKHIDLPISTDTEYFEKIYNNSIKPIINQCYDNEITLPAVGELKAHILKLKAAGEKIVWYDFGEKLPCVDANKLLKIIEIGQDIKIYANENSLKPLMFKFNDGTGLLFPIRK